MSSKVPSELHCETFSKSVLKVKTFYPQYLSDVKTILLQHKKKQNIIILIVGKVVNDSIRQGKSPNIRTERIMMSQVTAALPLTNNITMHQHIRLDYSFAPGPEIYLLKSAPNHICAEVPRKLRLSFQFQRPASSNNSNTVSS